MSVIKINKYGVEIMEEDAPEGYKKACAVAPPMLLESDSINRMCGKIMVKPSDVWRLNS